VGQLQLTEGPRAMSAQDAIVFETSCGIYIYIYAWAMDNIKYNFFVYGARSSFCLVRKVSVSKKDNGSQFFFLLKIINYKLKLN
jgi:hypothetical protein